MANPATAPEPSMEEILASIRQIISEDGEAASSAAAGKTDASGSRSAAKSQEKDATSGSADAEGKDAGPISEKGPDMDALAEADLAKAEDAFAADDDDAGEEVSGVNSGEEGSKGDSIGDSEPATAGHLTIKADVDSDVEESISMAMPAQSKEQPPAPAENGNLLSEDSDQVVHGAFSALAHTILAQNARTLEDLVSEMLQPMLQGWLDDNLPSLVERLVKEEIDRVSRGRR